MARRVRLGEQEAAASSQAMSLAEFEVGTALGSGRFGMVYAARHKPTGLKVALKVLFKKALQDADCVLQLRREVEVQSRLSHPHILRLFGTFHDKNKVYLVLEFADGGEVFKKLQAAGSFAEGKAAKHISSVASALKYMHDRSVFHRDMKPENLLYAENDRIVISDFGWTVHAPGDASKRHTICGTPAYLPPEMLSGKPHDGSADAWALGVLTYELLYGFPPFDPERAPTIADNSSPSKPTPPPTLAIQAADPLTASTYQRIAAGAFAFPPTPRVSDDAKAFIASLLTVDEAERATLAAAVQHPWLSALVDSSLTKAPLSPSAHLDRAGAAKLSPPPAAVATSRGALRAARLAASSMASSPPPPPQLSSPPPPADSRAHSSTTASVSTGSSVGSSTASTGPRRIAQPGGTSSSGGPRRSAGGSSKSTSSSTGSAVADAVRSASSRMLRRAGSSSTGGGSIGSSTGSAGGARRVAVAPPSVQEKPALQPSAAANQGATTSGGGKQRLQPRERQPTTADWRKYLKQQGAPAVPSV